MQRVLSFACLTLSLLVLSGCGNSGGTLSGKVTFNDQPVTGGTVVFVSEDKSKTEHVPIQPDGTFSSPTLPFGKILVAVLPAPQSLAASMPAGAKFSMPADSPYASKMKMYDKSDAFVDIPQAFRDPATSNLSVSVAGGAQSYDIPLKDAK